MESISNGVIFELRRLIRDEVYKILREPPPDFTTEDIKVKQMTQNVRDAKRRIPPQEKEKET